MTVVESFKKSISEYSIDISEKQLSSFERYYELLIEWNEKINLTAITQKEDVYVKHFLDSVSIIKICDLHQFNNLIDVGTGAGFPGIPIKILFPHLKITLLDSLNKRLVFLNTVIEELGLTDIYTIHGRAEDIARLPEHRDKYDICVSRAVANLSTLSELCLPFVKKDGYFISYKSDKINDEINESKNAIQLLGGNIGSEVSFKLDDYDRTLLSIQKLTVTPKKYPRKAGTPAKDPIR